MELEKLAFVLEVHDAIDRCGTTMVFNMDESPASLLDPPVTAVVAKGSKQAAKVRTPAKVPTRYTTFATLSAAGSKLPLCAILRGKTPRCLKNTLDHPPRLSRKKRAERRRRRLVVSMPWCCRPCAGRPGGCSTLDG